MPPRKKPRRWTDLKIEKFNDSIKDAIDRLAQVPAGRSRVQAARDLVDYIELHHLQGVGRG